MERLAQGLSVRDIEDAFRDGTGRLRDAETVTAFFQDMRARGLGDPLLFVSDGAPGTIKAIETCFPRSARQRCLAHRMRDLAAKVPEDQWPGAKAHVHACYKASRAIARDLAAADYARGCRAPSPASRATSRPASPTCACPSPTAAR